MSWCLLVGWTKFEMVMVMGMMGGICGASLTITLAIPLLLLPW